MEMDDPFDDMEEHLMSEPEDPMTVGCLYPTECVMSGPHTKAECYTPIMADPFLGSMPMDYVPTGSALDDVPRCQACGCTDFEACPGGCIWATPDLCSRCVG